MAISREEVLEIAALARLRLSDDEVERFSGQLSSILRHIDALAEVDLEGGEPSTLVESQAPLRPDDAALEAAGPDVLAFPLTQLAPAFERGLFTVPRLSALDGTDS